MFLHNMPTQASAAIALTKTTSLLPHLLWLLVGEASIIFDDEHPVNAPVAGPSHSPFSVQLTILESAPHVG